MSDKVDLAYYLFRRLYQVGVRSLFGVPGDYNLTALDYVQPAGLHWVGNANELNAAYEADGYARIKGISAVITAFGVGELSAMNGIAGAYAERAPVVHIVGTPSTMLQNQGACMHHTLGEGNYRVYAEMAAKVTVFQTNLTDPSTAPGLIDQAIKECVWQSRPVYIEIPMDAVHAKIPAAMLERPIDLSIPPNDEGFEDTEVDLILDRIYSAKQPVIIVDGFTARYGISHEVDELVRATGFPTVTTPFGKGIVNETYPNFHGVYAGNSGKLRFTPWMQACDLVLRVGPLNSDVNTCGFTTMPDPKVTITFHRDMLEVGGSDNNGRYQNLHVKSLLGKLLDRIEPSRLPKYNPYPNFGDPRQALAALPPPEPNGIIDQDTFYQRISSFFRPGDIVMTETGTPSVGSRDFVLPADAVLINSSIWLSIGYMLGAAGGAALAQREMIEGGSRQGGRTILFEGDGSLQMSAQAISDIIHNRLDMTIFVINNDGYTIERWIHGMQAHYNDVRPWRYLEAPSYFGAPDDGTYRTFTRRVATWGELNALLDDKAFQDGKGLQLVEIMMEREDAPESLKILVQPKKAAMASHAKMAQDRLEAVEQKVVGAAG